MSLKAKKLFFAVSFSLVIAALLIYFYPYLFSQLVKLQKLFNLLLSECLRKVNRQPGLYGGYLIVICFLYGVVHAVGPGHGKFIIASFMATHPSYLKLSVILSLVATLLQGLTAIVLTLFFTVIMKLSYAHFSAGQLYAERTAYFFLLVLGAVYLLQSVKVVVTWNTLVPFMKKKTEFDKKQARELISKRINSRKALNTAVKSELKCGCSAQHLISARQWYQAKDLKSQILVILSIGLRPCSGAVFMLFLSYILNLYGWGVIACVAMSLGTGITLTLFALTVQYARALALRFGALYPDKLNRIKIGKYFKGGVGLAIICLSIMLIYSSFERTPLFSPFFNKGLL